MTKVRTGPDCASIGLARDAFAGREAQPGVLAPGPAPDRRGLVRRQVVHDDEQPVPVRPGSPDRLQRGQGVTGALMLASDAPQLVIAHAGAAVEVADAVGAMISRAQPGRPFARHPAHAVAGPAPAAARTGRRRSNGPGRRWSRTRSGPAWRPGPDRRTPSRSGSAGTRCRAREGAAAAAPARSAPAGPGPLNTRPACASPSG